jgi:hypothetical protein
LIEETEKCNGVLVLNLFLMGGHYGREGVTRRMEQLKTTRKVLTEMNESYLDLLRATKETTRDIHATQQLWRASNKSRLIKIGIALVVFPEPTPTSEIVGACFIVAGAVQKAIKNRALFAEDVTKTFQSTLKEISAIKQNL